MLENNDNRKNDVEQDVQQTTQNGSAGDAPSKKLDIVNIKNYVASIGKVVWNFVKGYLVIIKEWFTGKRSSRTDRVAMAICLLFAVSVWLYVMSNNDTGFEKELTGVTVNIEGAAVLGAENMSVLDGYDQTVKVTLEGKRAEIGSLTADDLYIYVDVSQIKDAGQYTLQVMLDLPKNSSLVSIEPSHISLDVDVNAVKKVDVDIKLQCQHDASYTISKHPNYDSVIIVGPASVLDTVKYAAATFNVGMIDKSLNLVGELALYDSYGVEISNPYVTCSQSEVSVLIKVTTTKTVPLSIKFANGISQPYKSTLTPSSIELIGDPNVLRDIDEIVAYTVKDGEIKVGSPLIMTIREFDIPEGVSAVGDPVVSIYIERMY